MAELRMSPASRERSCMDSRRTSVIAMRVAAVTIVALALVSSASAASVVRTWFPQGDQLRYGMRAVDGHAPVLRTTLQRAARRARRPAEARDGARTAFARGTRLLGLHRQGSLVTIQLDRRFLQQTAHATTPAAVRTAPPPRPPARPDALAVPRHPALQAVGLGAAARAVPGSRSALASRRSRHLGPRRADPRRRRSRCRCEDRARRRRRSGADPARPDVPRRIRLARRERGDGGARLRDDAGADGVRGVERTRSRRRADDRVIRTRAAGGPPGAAAHRARAGSSRSTVTSGSSSSSRTARSSGRCTRPPGSAAARRPGRSTSIARSSSPGRCRSRSGCRGPRTSTGGFAMHAVPVRPGVPASHGCVRLPAPEAQRVYAFAVEGTPVYVS